MSLALQIDLSGIAEVEKLIARINSLQFSDLLDSVGSEVVAQSQLRIQHDKTDPQGEPWKPWSDRYARTRHAGHSLLMNEGDLLESIQHVVTDSQVAIGSNRVYAARQNFGDDEEGIPARPYLGLSDENREDIVDIIRAWSEAQLQ